MIRGINKRLSSYYPELRGSRKIIRLREIPRMKSGGPATTRSTTVTKSTGHGTITKFYKGRTSARFRRSKRERAYARKNISRFRRFLLKNYKVMSSYMKFKTFHGAINNTSLFYAQLNPPYLRAHIGYSRLDDQYLSAYDNNMLLYGVLNTFPAGQISYPNDSTPLLSNDLFFAMDWPGTLFNWYQNVDAPVSGEIRTWPWFGLVPQHRLSKPNVAFCYTDDVTLGLPDSSLPTNDWNRWKTRSLYNPMWADPRADAVYVVGYKIRMKFTNIDYIPYRVNVYTFMPAVGPADLDVYYNQLDRNFTTRTNTDTNIGLITMTEYLESFTLPQRLYKKGTLKCKTFILGPNTANFSSGVTANPLMSAVTNSTYDNPCINYVTLKSKKICKKIERSTNVQLGQSTWSNEVLRDRAMDFRYCLIVAFPIQTIIPYGLDVTYSLSQTSRQNGQYVAVDISKQVKWVSKPSSTGATAN